MLENKERKIIAIILLIILIPLLYSMINLNNINWPPYATVSSNSMNPTLEKGDIVFLNSQEKEKMEVGDIAAIITPKKYREKFNYPKKIIHRIKRIENINGKKYFITKGDKNNNEDLFKTPISNIQGIYSGIKIPHLGYIFLFSRSNIGIFTILLSSGFSLTVFITIRYIKNQKIKNKKINNIFHNINKIDKKTNQLDDIKSKIDTIESRINKIENNKDLKNEKKDGKNILNKFLKKRKKDLKKK